MKELGIRWTVGDVNLRGFEALQLSIWGIWKIFGSAARYAVCVNQVEIEIAKERTGVVPAAVEWRKVRENDIPALIQGHMDEARAEGMGWKFAPLRLFPDLHELALDNDCILWELPPAIRLWLESDNPLASVMAEDVRSCFGQFESFCAPEPRNGGIRGLSPGFNYLEALRGILHEHPVTMRLELDEQGLQTAALQRSSEPLIVTSNEVTICSPFWPHSPHLGECGAHFVGLNAHHIAWSYFDRPADEWMSDHWQKYREILVRKMGIPSSVSWQV